MPIHWKQSIFLILLLPVTLGFTQPSENTLPQLGTNLSGPVDWNTELPFVDVFRMSRAWISQHEEAEWGQGPELDLDEYGWVKRLEPNAYAETLLCTIEGGQYPAGQYTVLYEGEGRLNFWGAAQVASSEPGRMLIDVDPNQGAIFLQIRETNPENYVRNIRVIMPGFDDTYEENPWHPVFLERWQGLACFRYMDFMHTNHSNIQTWDDRPTLQHATFSEKGVALEWLIDLSNRQKVDPWFCMPHQADDDYVRHFAQQVKEQLDPELSIYVEYSNETWNSTFEQHHYTAQQGQALGFGEQPWVASWHYTAHRSVEIFKIWEEVFEGNERLVRVLPTQAANDYVSRQIVEFQDAYQNADALAIAPYISFNISPEGDPPAATVAEWNVDQALDYMENQALPEAKTWIELQKAVADELNLKLIAYEGGQHMVGIFGAENNEQLTQLFHQANAHPRMGDIYREYYSYWETIGGELFCNFSSVNEWSKWGSWGLLQYYDEDPTQSPKFMATMEWAHGLGQAVILPATAVNDAQLHQNE